MINFIFRDKFVGGKFSWPILYLSKPIIHRLVKGKCFHSLSWIFRLDEKHENVVDSRVDFNFPLSAKRYASLLPRVLSKSLRTIQAHKFNATKTAVIPRQMIGIKSQSRLRRTHTFLLLWEGVIVRNSPHFIISIWMKLWLRNILQGVWSANWFLLMDEITRM